MKNVLVRDIPDDVHAELQRRAALNGQSLQQYLSTELRRLAGRPTLAEVLDRIEQRGDGMHLDLELTLEALDEGRNRL